MNDGNRLVHSARWFLFAASILLTATTASAQHQYDQWLFGISADYGLDFRGGAPVRLNHPQVGIQFNEGSATICDPVTGDLLFFSNSVNVYDRRYRVMANGDGLLSATTSTQGVLVVPVPGDPSRYYLFTVDQEGYDGSPKRPNRGMAYDIIDMNGNGGFGAVTVKNQILHDTCSERLTAVRSVNGRDWWVIAHSLGRNEFWVHRVTAAGVGSADTFHVGVDQVVPDNDNNLWQMGYLKASPNGTLLAMASRTTGIVELFRFDPCTGRISDPILIPGDVNDTFPYGLSFSPDSRLLYVTRRDLALYQYDVSNYRSDSVRNSAMKIADRSGIAGAMQIGPDGKIYTVNTDDRLGRIESPNVRGTGCNWVPDWIDVSVSGTNRETFGGLPNNIDAFDHSIDTVDFALDDSVFCGSGCVSILPLPGGPMPAPDWYWSFPGGTPDTATGHTPPDHVCYDSVGRYPVILRTACAATTVDSVVHFVIVSEIPELSFPDSAASCQGAPVQLVPEISGGAEPLSYAWSPADGLSCADCRQPVATIDTTTTYTLTVTTAYGCTATDSVRVVIAMPAIVDAGPDIEMCRDQEAVEIQPSVTGGQGPYTYTWSPADGLSCVDCERPMARPDATTTYTLTVTTSDGCIATDTVRVDVSLPPTVDAGPDVAMCEDSEPIEIAPNVTGGREPYTYQWSPASGLSCTDCARPMARPDKTTNYTLTVTSAAGCVSSDQMTVRVFKAPIVDAGPDAHLCSADSSVTLAATADGLGNALTYAWTPVDGLSCADCLNPTASPSGTTVYHLMVSNAGGCVVTDSVEVLVGARTLDIGVNRSLYGAPGDTIRTPVQLLDSLGGEAVTSLRATLSFDSTVVRLLNADDIDSLTHGTLLDGWTTTVVEEGAGHVTYEFTPPPGGGLLPHSGRLLNLVMRIYLAAVRSTEIQLSVEVDGPFCTTVQSHWGRASVQICGLGLRLMELNDLTWALDENIPEPVVDKAVINYTIALPGPARLELMDANGSLVEVLFDRYCDQGSYVYLLDATALPSGVYYYRLTSGDWSATRRMTVMK